MTRAMYPGTFDPIHYGHIDVATRAGKIFDELVVAVYDAPPKKLLFDTDERVGFARKALQHLDNVSVVAYTGLTVECARQVDANVVVRGLRNVADFEFEHQIGMANRHLAPDVELCCLFCNSEYVYLSSTILKEVASLGGDYGHWTTAHVRDALAKRFPVDETSVPNRIFTRTDSKFQHHG